MLQFYKKKHTTTDRGQTLIYRSHLYFFKFNHMRLRSHRKSFDDSSMLLGYLTPYFIRIIMPPKTMQESLLQYRSHLLSGAS